MAYVYVAIYTCTNMQCVFKRMRNLEKSKNTYTYKYICLTLTLSIVSQ